MGREGGFSEFLSWLTGDGDGEQQKMKGAAVSSERGAGSSVKSSAESSGYGRVSPTTYSAQPSGGFHRCKDGLCRQSMGAGSSQIQTL